MVEFRVGVARAFQGHGDRKVPTPNSPTVSLYLWQDCVCPLYCKRQIWVQCAGWSLYDVDALYNDNFACARVTGCTKVWRVGSGAEGRLDPAGSKKTVNGLKKRLKSRQSKGTIK